MHSHFTPIKNKNANLFSCQVHFRSAQGWWIFLVWITHLSASIMGGCTSCLSEKMCKFARISITPICVEWVGGGQHGNVTKCTSYIDCIVTTLQLNCRKKRRGGKNTEMSSWTDTHHISVSAFVANRNWDAYFERMITDSLTVWYLKLQWCKICGCVPTFILRCKTWAY